MRHDSDVDLYGVLGVSPAASTHEIRRAYRRLARRHHPDHNPHPRGSERFIALARAYAILNDPAQRASYDRTLLERSPPDGSRPVTTHDRGERQAVRYGTLELSVGEARQLACRPLTFTDGHGRMILVPAGAADGDAITLLYDDDRVLLTIRVRGGT